MPKSEDQADKSLEIEQLKEHVHEVQGTKGKKGEEIEEKESPLK